MPGRLFPLSGWYVLFDATDAKLTAAYQADFRNLWEEDVFEVFLWPDEQQQHYFEYEISPLGFELPLTIANQPGQLFRSRPWYYDEQRLGVPRTVRKATSVTGGSKQSGSTITNWTAEMFLPYTLLKPLQNVPPQPGTHWRANFYRVDHDDKQVTSWSWVSVGRSFHEIQKFGTLVFE